MVPPSWALKLTQRTDDKEGSWPNRVTKLIKIRAVCRLLLQTIPKRLYSGVDSPVGLGDTPYNLSRRGPAPRSIRT